MFIFLGFLILLILIWLIILQSDYSNFKESVKNKLSRMEKKGVIENSSAIKVEPEIYNEPCEMSAKSEPQPPVQKDFQIPEAKLKEFELKKASSFNFEKFFMENIFNKIGAIALVIGLAIFIKLISPFFVFTPPMQIAAGFLAGLVMVFGSIKLHKDEMKNYAEVLMGAGFAVLFIATYCGCSLYNIIPIPLATIIGAILVVATYFIAQKYKSFSTISIGLLGGYLNPFFINAEVSSTFLFSYLIFVNLISIVYVQKNQDKIALNYINLILTTLTVSIFSSFKGSINLALPLILWGAYLANDLINIKNEYKDELKYLSWLNFGALIWFVNYIFKFQDNLSSALTVLSAGLIYAFCAYFNSKTNKEIAKNYLYGVLSSILIATYFMSNGVLRTSVWALEALAIAFFASKFKQRHLENWSLTFLLAAFTSIFFNQNAISVRDIRNYTPLWNERTILFALPTLSAFVSSKLLMEQNKKISDLLRFLYISFIYLFVTFEFNLILSKATYKNNYYTEFAEFIKWMSYSIIGFTYTINMKRLYNTSNYQLFNIASYMLFVVAFLIMLIWGWTYSPLSMFIPVLNIRFAAFIVAITASLLYAKWEKKEFFKYLAIILGLLLLNYETGDLLLAIDLTNANIILSTVWILYSGIIMLLGIFKNIKPLKLSGIWITIIAIFKILIFDLVYVDAIYKIIAFLSLGVILMIVSYFYTKNKGIK